MQSFCTLYFMYSYKNRPVGELFFLVRIREKAISTSSEQSAITALISRKPFPKDVTCIISLHNPTKLTVILL